VGYLLQLLAVILVFGITIEAFEGVGCGLSPVENEIPS